MRTLKASFSVPERFEPESPKSFLPMVARVCKKIILVVSDGSIVIFWNRRFEVSLTLTTGQQASKN